MCSNQKLTVTKIVPIMIVSLSFKFQPKPASFAVAMAIFPFLHFLGWRRKYEMKDFCAELCHIFLDT